MPPLTAQQLERFDRQGYLFFPNLLDPERDLKPIIEEYHGVLDQLAAEMYAKEEISSQYEELPFEQRLIKIYQETGKVQAQYFDFHLPPHQTKKDTPGWWGPAVFNALRNDKILDVIESLIGGEIYSNPIQHVRMKPPEHLTPIDPKTGLPQIAATPWHQDNGVGTPEVDNTEMITVWFPLKDATVENGCLEILPGSHRQGLLVHCPTGKKNKLAGLGIPEDQFPVDEMMPMPMKAGGALVFGRRLIHGSLANKSNEVRWSFDLRYNPVGQATGRDSLPGFIARSRKNPSSGLRDWRAWRQMWHDCRERLAEHPVATYNRWNAEDPVCA
ncbi:MAG: phytanoyl-CoA dioxygenase family protein [Chloroflexi bacterium]|nr:phytanoyl-CoA dioxygenase family protein [Chloroflexota bacterium]